MKRAAILLLILFYASQATAADTFSNLDPRVDQDLRTTATPTFAGLILTGGDILSAVGINLKPSGDIDDYLSWETVGNVPQTTIMGGNLWRILSSTGNPAFVFDDGTGNKVVFGWNGASSRGEWTTFGDKLIQTSSNNGNITLSPHGTGVVNILSALNMGFYPITDPGDVNAGIDATAITDQSETLYWTLNGALTATTGGVDLVEQSSGATPDYTDRGTFKAWLGDGVLYFKAAGVEGPLGADARTTLAWVKTETSGGGNKTIFDYGNTGTAQRWQFFLNTTGNTMIVGLGGSAATTVADSRVSDGQWHLFSVSLAGGAGGNESDEVIFTIDGETVTNNTSPGVTINTVTDTDSFVGANQAAGNRMTNPMGLVAVCDVGLNSDQLLNIFNRTKERTVVGTTLPDCRDMADPIVTLSTGTFGTLLIGSGSITDSSGAISFGNESLTTTGTINTPILNGPAGLTLTSEAFSPIILTAGLGSEIIFTIAATNVGKFIASGLQFNDNIGTISGTGSDTSIKFNGADLIINSENVTADDELLFTNFTKYVFDNDVETSGSMTASEYHGTSDIKLKEDGVFFGIDDSAKIFIGTDAFGDPGWIFCLLDVEGSPDSLTLEGPVIVLRGIDEGQVDLIANTMVFMDEDKNSYFEVFPEEWEIAPRIDILQEEWPIRFRDGTDQGYIMRVLGFAKEVDIDGLINQTYPTGDVLSGEFVHAIHINIDESLAVSSDSNSIVCGLDFGTTTNQDITKMAICIGPGFDDALVIQGASAEDPNHGYEITGGVVADRVSGVGDGSAFINDVNNLVIFDNNDDYILMGSDNTFEDIQVVLSVPASGSIFSNPTSQDFYYSKAGGNWTLLTILDDGTNGMQQSGNIAFKAPVDWTKDDEAEVNGDIANAYYIKTIRTRTILGTPPTELHFKIFASLETGMKIRGDGTVKPGSWTDAEAPNDSIYYSTTQGKLVYKDSGGGINDLY